MSSGISSPCAHPLQRLFGNNAALMIHIDTDSPDPVPNLVAANLLLQLLFYWLRENLINFGYYGIGTGFVVMATVRVPMLALQAMGVVINGRYLLPEQTEVAWFDPSELIVRDFHSPQGLAFERLVPEIMSAHERVLALPPA